MTGNSKKPYQMASSAIAICYLVLKVLVATAALGEIIGMALCW
jgi:hypothetical protein